MDKRLYTHIQIDNLEWWFSTLTLKKLVAWIHENLLRDMFSCLPVDRVVMKCKADVDCHFYDGGRVCILFEGILNDVWLKSYISTLWIIDSFSWPLKLYYDNSIAIFMTKNNKNGSQSKNIDIIFLDKKRKC